jgi:hypothetical protein
MLVAFTISTGGSVHSKVWHDGMVINMWCVVMVDRNY